VRFRLNEHGEPIEIVFHQSSAANHLIEEFMLLANRIVAKEAGGNGRLEIGERLAGRGERLEVRGERREGMPKIIVGDKEP
jgi:hypothetical protein